MVIPEPRLFDDWPKVAQVRRSDPRTAKAASALDPNGRRYQRNVILKHLLGEDVDAITADEAGRLIGRHRHIASSRLGVLQDEGLVEKCGSKPDADEYGKVREVALYRLTPDGLRDAALMFGGGS